MSSQTIIRPYQSGDEEGIVKLLEQVFQGWPHFDLLCSPLDHWIWKYLDNPLKKNYITVAFDNGIIIGCDHTIPQKIKIGDKSLLCGTSTDVAVDPEYRNKGIYNKLRELKFINEQKEGIKYQLDISYNPILIKQNTSRGYPVFLHDVISYYKIKDVDSLVKNMPIEDSFILKYGFIGSYSLNIIKKKFDTLYFKNKLEYKYENIKIEKINLFSDEINTFWDIVKNQYNYIIEVNKDYLNWRYCDSHGGNYTVWLGIKENVILGYIVLRINKYNKNHYIGYIVDLLTLPNFIGVADYLISNAVKYFEKENINVVIYWGLNNNQYDKYLRKYDFIPRMNPSKLFFKFFADIEEIHRINKSMKNQIHINYGNWDGI